MNLLRRVFRPRIVAVVALWASTATGAVFTVTKTADTLDGTCDADCSLREAIVAANASPGPDTVSVPAGSYVLAIAGMDEDAGATGDLDVTDELVLAGAGSSATIVDAAQLDRAIHVLGVTATVSGLAVQQGGVVWYGGGVWNEGGDLTLEGTILRDGGAVYGAGVSNSGILTLRNSTLSENSAVFAGGLHNQSGATASVLGSTIVGNSSYGAFGDGSGGGIGNLGSLTLTNVTISQNTAGSAGGGGGLRNGPATATLTNVTIAENTASVGAGILNDGSLTLTNTLVANNSIGDCDGVALVSNGHNLDTDGSCGLTQPTDLPGVPDAGLAPLQDNGGPSETHALLATSPALDAGDDSVCAAAPVSGVDQRGIARPQAGACDIGALELACGVDPCCSDGTVDPVEECDDGNSLAGDCCSARCQFEVGPGMPACCDQGVCQAGAGCGAVCFTPGGVCQQPGGAGTPCTCELP